MNRWSFRRCLGWVCCLLAGAALTACGQTMMATPVMFNGAAIDPFSEFDETDRTDEVTILYATNRSPGGTPDDRSFGNGVRDELSLGAAEVRFGNGKLTWAELYEASTTAKRKKSISVKLGTVTELAVFGPDEDPRQPSAGTRAFAEHVNAILAGEEWKDITIYVHGANTDFAKPARTAGDFHHFMGRHGIMMVFAWPTTQSPITYGTDVKHAALSVGALSRLLEFLALNTDVERINLIGYSAGAQVLSPAMYELREKYGNRSGKDLQAFLKAGEVYFAAPDIDLRTFAVDHLPRYHDIALSTTLTINLNDGVLGLAQMAHGGSRAGRPDIDELTEEETELVAELARLGQFNVIDMSTSKPPAEANIHGHAYWYQSPWVSTDIIIQFIFHADPASRGLELVDLQERPVWYYPDDYPQRVISRLKAYLATLEEGESAVR
jgi:esterase/lipase superfamily enzyme